MTELIEIKRRELVDAILSDEPAWDDPALRAEYQISLDEAIKLAIMDWFAGTAE